MNDTNQTDSLAPSAGKPAQSIPLNLALDSAFVTRLLDLFRESVEKTFAQASAKAQVSAEAESRPAPERVEPTPLPKSTGLDLKAADRMKAADLRVALLVGKIPDDAGLLIDTKTLSRLLNVSRATLYCLQAEEAIPVPVHLGNLKKWRLAEILEWIEADCPPLRVWIHKRQDASKRKGK